MQIPETSQITIVSVLITGISVLWAYFTKKDSARDKQAKEDGERRENLLNSRVQEKDAAIVSLTKEAIKSTSDVKNAVDNNTAVIKELHTLTQQVMNELIRIKANNNH